MRDDFSEGVRVALARRVNNTCSNPECCAPTAGPHSDESKSVSVGVAAHISGAAARGPRYRVELTPEQRSAISNAIWLCQTCATKIDRDAARYPEQTLREWKTGAEARADRGLGRPTGAGNVDASTAPTGFIPAPPDGNAISEAKLRFQHATSNWRQRHGGIAGFMEMRAVPLERIAPLRFEPIKQLLAETRVRERRVDSDYSYPSWTTPAWRPPGYLEAEAPRDFPPSLLHIDGCGAIAIARSHWEDHIHRDREPKILQVGQLARELAASFFFAVRVMRRLGVSAFEYSFTLFHADQRVVAMGAESARDQRAALSAKDSVLPVAARVDASCRPREVAVSLLEDMLAFLNVENTRRFADDTLADLEIDDLLR